MKTDSLDPQDWAQFRTTARQVLEDCLDRLESSNELPWIAPESPSLGTSPVPLYEMGLEELSHELTKNIMPYATGNTHPRFFGWVHGSGLPVGLLSEMVVATMNSNCGGRDHGAVYIERQVIDWSRQIFEMPKNSGGILTSGTSLSTLLALTAARTKLLGKSVRVEGIRQQPAMTVYAAEGTHHCIAKALEVMGIGSAALRLIPKDKSTNSICLKTLTDKLRTDREEGYLPMCIIGSAGSVDTGRFDNLSSLAEFCSTQNIWFHVDGAFGAWLKIADQRRAKLVHGIELADSIALDFHKWMYVQYEVGAVLVREDRWLKEAFGSRPDYLEGNAVGLAGGDPWYCDQGIELSRGFRALKVWTALKAHGIESLGQQITKNCDQAELMGSLVDQSPILELACPVISNVCCFRIKNEMLSTSQLDAFHKNIASQLQLTGSAVLSTTILDGRSVLRAAIVNHRTRSDDMAYTINAVSEVAQKIVIPEL